MRYLGVAGLASLLDVGTAGCSFLFDRDNCPISPTGRALLEEAVFKTVSDALFTAGLSHDSERAFALTLLGVERGYSSIMFLAGECKVPRVYDSFCNYASTPEPIEDPFWQTRDACGRYICESRGKERIEVYFTMRPRTSPDDRHEFSYPTVKPVGDAVYDPNPYIEWRFDMTKSKGWVITADISHAVRITTSAGESLDLSHKGKISVLKTGDEPSSLDLELKFLALAAELVTAILKIDYEAGGTVLGSVMLGNEVIASISGKLTGGPPRFHWTGLCG